MMPQLSEAFGLSATGVASMVGLFYYGYSPFSLVAGVAMDRLGPRRVVPLGAATVGVGALLFASGNTQAASVGRFLQGAGGVFALVGAAYIATTNFPASRAATLIGATQMFGMAGGSAGQFAGRADDRRGRLLERVLGRHGHPRPGDQRAARSCCCRNRQAPDAARRTGCARRPARSASVFRNPQSILCGVIAGLLFIPTTIFDMIWGVRYLQDARGLDYATAVMRSAIGAARLDHRLPAARLRVRSDRPAQAVIIVGRRRRAPRVPRVDPVRTDGRVSAVRARPRRRHRQRARRCCRTRSSRKPTRPA